MNRTAISLFWRDKNWEKRGVANNVWLTIFPDTKEYNKCVSSFCDTDSENIVEVKRKSDIEDMVKYLSNCGYKAYPLG